MTNWIIITALVFYVLVSLAVSVYLSTRDDLDRTQKSLQMLIVWLIPVLGALLLWQFNHSQDMPMYRHKEFGGGSHNSNDNGSGAE